METAIVLIGMLFPIAAASIFYAGDERKKRRQGSDTTIATPQGSAARVPEARIGESPFAPAETALAASVLADTALADGPLGARTGTTAEGNDEPTAGAACNADADNVEISA